MIDRDHPDYGATVALFRSMLRQGDSNFTPELGIVRFKDLVSLDWVNNTGMNQARQPNVVAHTGTEMNLVSLLTAESGAAFIVLMHKDSPKKAWSCPLTEANKIEVAAFDMSLESLLHGEFELKFGRPWRGYSLVIPKREPTIEQLEPEEFDQLVEELLFTEQAGDF